MAAWAYIVCFLRGFTWFLTWFLPGGVWSVVHYWSSELERGTLLDCSALLNAFYVVLFQFTVFTCYLFTVISLRALCFSSTFPAHHFVFLLYFLCIASCCGAWGELRWGQYKCSECWVEMQALFRVKYIVSLRCLHQRFWISVSESWKHIVLE